MKPFGILSSVLLVATGCGPSAKSVPTVGINSSADAAAFASSGYALAAQTQADKKESAARDSAATTSITTTGDCATSGTFSFSASESVSGSASSTTTTSTSTSSTSTSTVSNLAGSATATFKAKSCTKTDAYFVDGELDYSETLNFALIASGGQFLDVKANGVLAIQTFNTDGSIKQSGDVSYNNFEIKMSSTVSGGTTCVAVTATGSFAIGGKTWTPTGAELAAAFGDGFSSTGATATVCK